MNSMLTNNTPGQRTLLMGNEAIARGALEAGVQVCASYPGNPSTEITESLIQAAKELNLYVEWSINEKVAMEIAAAASFAGLRGLTAMKQNGLNVAADFLFMVNLSGCRGGFVIVVCDDPSALSSGNEEDCRAFAKLADLPLLEPSTAAEAKEMTKWAFEISEEFGIPCLIRSVTRISHMRGNVTLAEMPTKWRVAHFDPSQPIFPTPVSITHKALHEKIKRCREKFEISGFNFYQGPENPEVLIVTSGSGWLYVREALEILNCKNKLGILKLGTTWPLPEKLIVDNLKKASQIVFLEEVDPFLEDGIKALYAQRVGEIGVKTFLGKATGTIPAVGEMNPDLVITLLKNLLQIKYEPRPQDYAKEAQDAVARLAPFRQLSFCAGCPHRATYWTIMNALARDDRLGFVLGDIGCYSLGRHPQGFAQMKTFQAMGSGIGVANGFGQFARFGLDQPVLAICGDSTFYHAAIPALINARWNGANFLLLVLDNNATAMTGFQPHPGTGRTALGKPAQVPSVEKLCEIIGTQVEVVDPFHVQTTIATINRLIDERKGIKVLVLKQPCALLKRKRQKDAFKLKVNQDRCVGSACGCNRLCTRVFKCPGLAWDKKTGKALIDEAICTNCGVCADICPAQAITKEAV